MDRKDKLEKMPVKSLKSVIKKESAKVKYATVDEERKRAELESVELERRALEAKRAALEAANESEASAHDIEKHAVKELEDDHTASVKEESKTLREERELKRKLSKK